MTAIRAAFKAYPYASGVNNASLCTAYHFALGLAAAVFPVDAEYYFNPRF